MAKFGNHYLILNLIPQILNMLLYAAIIQNKDVVIIVELEMEVENAKF